MMDNKERLNMRTVNLADEKFTALAKLFPNAVTEAIDENGKVIRAIDADMLRQEINTHVVEGREERYQFTWPDKKKSIHLANSPIAATLRPCREESVDFDNTENLYIEGDNLDVLKLLRETYLGRVKMIYIDPPYNTGNDFVYEDDFKGDKEEFLRLDYQYDEEGNRMVKNLDSNGRFHTDWLNMIYPRLRVAKDLLAEDGVIFISCDDNECKNVQNIMDEVFGEGNFITQFIWAAGRKNDSKLVSISHEYIITYAKSKPFLQNSQTTWRERKDGLDEIYEAYSKLKKQYKDDYQEIQKRLREWYKSLPKTHPARNNSLYNCVDERGIYFAADISWPGGGGPKFEVLHPITKKPVKIPSRGWMFGTLERMLEVAAENRIHFGTDESSVPCIKSYLNEHEVAAPYSVFYQDGRAATKRLRAIMGADVFENPKDEDVIRSLTEIIGSKDGIILDFFSGSGTTAHAVFLQNVADNGNRKFIMVQLPELCDDKTDAGKTAIKLEWNTIADIGKERIRRAAEKIKAEKRTKAEKDGLFADYTDTQDYGFRVLKLDSSNMKEVYYKPEEYAQKGFDIHGFADNIKEDRSGEDLLFQVMLDLDIPLSAKIKQEGEIFYVNDNYLIACFAKVNMDMLTTIAKQKPYYAVFRDSSFQSDSAMVNFEQVFKTHSPQTIRKIL
jgi:adenine-specific DNA-methyltransferase